MTPISDCEVRDPRIRRTRQLLQGALEKLMRTRSFEEISVQEITEEATVNRATFYDHYTDKFALLDALIAGGFHQLLFSRNVTFDGSCPAAASSIIQATCDYLAQIHAEHPGCTGNNSFEPLIDAAITSAIRRVITSTSAKMAAPALSEMACTAVSWAIYGAARQWSLTPDRLPVHEVVPQILAFVQPILQQQLESHSGQHEQARHPSLGA